jgi:hypothetical protein
MNTPRQLRRAHQRNRHSFAISLEVKTLMMTLKEIGGRKIVHCAGVIAAGSFDMLDDCVTSTDYHGLLERLSKAPALGSPCGSAQPTLMPPRAYRGRTSWASGARPAT